jgi:uncharacterized cupin superfamily protein
LVCGRATDYPHPRQETSPNHSRQRLAKHLGLQIGID